MLELVCFLLPLAALSGFYIGKRSRETKPSIEKNPKPTEPPAKVVDAFIKMLDVSPESVETILALGNFFRRRGEVEKAITIHQNLVSKPNLTPKERCQCLLDLAQDYMCAGVYDRAESLLLEIKEGYSYQRETTLSYLIDIYEREKDWEKAIEMALLLQEISRESKKAEIAHYYCELSELAWERGKVKLAFKYLDQGLKYSLEPRIHFLRGSFNLKLGKNKQALESLCLLAEDLFYFSLVYPLIQACFSQLEKENDYDHLPKKERLAELNLQRKPANLCKQCGFNSRRIHWQCPSCRQWATLKPIQVRG